MTEIVLSNKEIELIKKHFNGLIGLGASKEVQEIFGGVINKAEALMEELNAYDEVGGDLILWYWNKYQSQQREL